MPIRDSIRAQLSRPDPLSAVPPRDVRQLSRAMALLSAGSAFSVAIALDGVPLNFALVFATLAGLAFALGVAATAHIDLRGASRRQPRHAAPLHLNGVVVPGQIFHYEQAPRLREFWGAVALVWAAAPAGVAVVGLDPGILLIGIVLGIPGMLVAYWQVMTYVRGIIRRLPEDSSLLILYIAAGLLVLALLEAALRAFDRLPSALMIPEFDVVAVALAPLAAIAHVWLFVDLSSQTWNLANHTVRRAIQDNTEAGQQ